MFITYSDDLYAIHAVVDAGDCYLDDEDKLQKVIVVVKMVW